MAKNIRKAAEAAQAVLHIRDGVRVTVCQFDPSVVEATWQGSMLATEKWQEVKDAVRAALPQHLKGCAIEII